jgi:hypothetical protein
VKLFDEGFSHEREKEKSFGVDIFREEKEVKSFAKRLSLQSLTTPY